MVWFSFLDDDEEVICNIDATDDLPDEVVSIEIEGPFDDDMGFLTSMLKSSTKKLEKITVDYFCCEAESPAFLAFVVLICGKTKNLCLTDCELSTNAVTCIMAAMLPHNGIQYLDFSWCGVPMPTDTVRILLEGVAASPCLESFDLSVFEFVNNQDASKYLIQALHRNQSLKEICLKTSTFSGKEFRDIVKASISEPNVKTVSIRDNERELPLGVLQDVLCRKDCTLLELHLQGVEIRQIGVGIHLVFKMCRSQVSESIGVHYLTDAHWQR